MQGSAGQQYGCQRINTPVNTLSNTVLGQAFVRIRSPMRTNIFTNAVEDNDSFIHRVADDCQNSRQEGCVDFQSEEGKDTQYHDQVMQNGNNGRYGNFILETERNICRQGNKGYSQTGYGIFRDFRPDDGTDRFGALYFRISQLSAELICQGLCFIARQVAHTDHNVLRRITFRYTGELNNAVIQIHARRIQYLANFGDCNGFAETQVQNRTARIVDAEVEAVHNNGHDAGNDQEGRQGEPPFTMFYNTEFHACPPFVSSLSNLRFNP